MDEKARSAEENQFISRGCYFPQEKNKRNYDMYNPGCSKLDVYDWLKDIIVPENQKHFDCVEVRFKNSRKDFYRIQEGMIVRPGDIVAVEASPGHDIGVVTLTGEIVRLQMRKKNSYPVADDTRVVYRKARATDIDKWIIAVENEWKTVIRTKEIIRELDLNMKINDVEYQGDNTKAIFYYTAEERVDFRELIKILAEEFKVRIEMRQIGVRQESGRLGGIGTCGRELCCSTWLTNFQSVTTNTARTQQLSLNPQKLAGQCGKLKCCLNYEHDTYVDILKNFPDSQIVLKTKKGEAIHQKSDIFRKVMWYTYIEDQTNMLALQIDKVFEIISQNEKGKFPEKLEDFSYSQEEKVDFENVAGQDDLNRFDD